MSSAEESPAQQAARLRRERREAKIKAGGASRLDKITSLSGRAPESVRTSSPSPATTPQSAPTPPPSYQQQQQAPFPNMADQTPAQVQAQEEYLRALLRSQAPTNQQQDQQQVPEDPTIRLLQSMLGGNIPGMPQPGGSEGGEGTSPTPEPIPGFSSADLASATGLPPFVTNMIFGGKNQPQTPEAQKQDSNWKLLHTVFALFIGVYLFLLYRRSTTMYGANPPPPATAQNPFLYFVTGELLLEGSRALLLQPGAAGGGFMKVVRTARQIGRDGSIVIFILGVGKYLLG